MRFFEHALCQCCLSEFGVPVISLRCPDEILFCSGKLNADCHTLNIIISFKRGFITLNVVKQVFFKNIPPSIL